MSALFLCSRQQFRQENIQKKKIPRKRCQFNRSQGFQWCPDSELNQGHVDFQSTALPTELSGHDMKFLKWWAIRDSNPGPAGYEPDALTN